MEFAPRERDLEEAMQRQDSREQTEHVETDAPRTPRSYRPETGLSYDQYRRSGYYDGFVEGQLAAGAVPFRYRHGEYASGGDPPPRGSADEGRTAARTQDAEKVTVRAISLSNADESLRAACEREACQQWPGARVFVDIVEERYRAAVYLPEDGLQPGASAQQTEPRDSARAALEELLDALRAQPSLREEP
jgi:hypothetical protein